MAATYTHTGRKASVGYMHYGDTDAFRGGAKAGKVHALNAAGNRGYEAVCGAVVPTYCHDHRCEERNPVERATTAPGVTCKACLRRKPVPVAVPKRDRHVVFLAICTGEVVRWSTESTREIAERYAAAIAERGSCSVTQPDGYVLHAWAETRREE